MASQEIKRDRTNGRWSKEEHEKFLQGLEMFGKNWKKIQTLIGTRNGSQIRSHAQKFFLKLGVKPSEFDESLENKDPSHTSQGVKKDKPLWDTVLDLTSPSFWEHIKSFAQNPAFSIWSLVDYRSNSELKKEKQESEIEEEEKKEGAQQTLVEKIQPFCRIQNGGFNVFSRSSEL